MNSPLIEGKLALGPRPSVSDLNSLKLEGITAIVDLNQNDREKREAEKIGLKYCADDRLKINDYFSPIEVDVLEYATNTIARLISEGHYVYLHCTAGLGRSPTIAAAYLIRLGRSKDEAMAEVRKIRPMAWLEEDQNYAGALDEFEKKCHNK